MSKIILEDNSSMMYTSKEKQEETGILEVKYKSGETRRINLHPSFFSSYEFPVSKRAEDIAYQYGKLPYYIGVTKGKYPMFEQNIRANQPDLFKGNAKKVDEFLVKKQLRKEFKHKPLRKISFEELNSFA